MSSSNASIGPPSLVGYDYLDRLGSGGFSEVFLYERQFPRQKVAIKVLVPQSLGDASRERFRSEANVMASLSTHPYIVSIYQADVSPEGFPYLVMEFYPKPNYSIRARTERFSVASVLRSGIQVAAAVETAHRSGVLHRDIKPANILTSEYGRPGLTDFGIALVGAAEIEEAEGMSIPWSPPEVVGGDGMSDARADVYSLAATLYTLLAGRSPFEIPGEANRSIELIDRIERAPLPPIDRPDVPGSLQRLLGQCMAKSPNDRPATAAEFARSLQAIEVEHRFDMTAFEVSEDLDRGPGTDPVDVDAGSTNLRGPAVIDAQSAAARERSVPGAPITHTPFVSGPSPAAAPVQLIHATPYLPSQTGGQPAVAPRQATTDHSTPAAASYAAPQPPSTVNLAEAERRGDRRLYIAAGFVAVLIAAGLLFFLLDPFGKDPGTTTTVDTGTAALAPPTDVFVERDPARENGWTVTWNPPKTFEPGDAFTVEWEDQRPAEVPGNAEYQITSQSTSSPCVYVRTIRDESTSDAAESAGCQ